MHFILFFLQRIAAEGMVRHFRLLRHVNPAYTSRERTIHAFFTKHRKHSSIEGLEEHASERKPELTDSGVVSEVLADPR